jgi:hypothetical protein
VKRGRAVDNSPVARWRLLVLVVGLLVAPRAQGQSQTGAQAPPAGTYPPPPAGTTPPPPAGTYPPPPAGTYPPPPAGYPPPGQVPPGQYPPGQYPGGYPPPTAYAPPGWAPAPPEPPHPRRVFSLTISPLHLLFPVVELTGEARAHDNVGIALVGGAGRITDSVSGIKASVWEAGAQVRVYVMGDFRHGMQIGAEALYLHIDAPDITATGEGLAIGPFLGYKVMTDEGFTFDTQLGVEHVSLRADAPGQSAAEKEFIPMLNLNIGWSF